MGMERRGKLIRAHEMHPKLSNQERERGEEEQKGQERER